MPSKGQLSKEATLEEDQVGALGETKLEQAQRARLGSGVYGFDLGDEIFEHEAASYIGQRPRCPSTFTSMQIFAPGTHATIYCYSTRTT